MPPLRIAMHAMHCVLQPFSGSTMRHCWPCARSMTVSGLRGDDEQEQVEASSASNANEMLALPGIWDHQHWREGREVHSLQGNGTDTTHPQARPGEERTMSFGDDTLDPTKTYDDGVREGRRIAEAELRAPGPCGKHPQACWTTEDEKPDWTGIAYCTACAEIAALKAEQDKLWEWLSQEVHINTAWSQEQRKALQSVLFWLSAPARVQPAICGQRVKLISAGLSPVFSVCVLKLGHEGPCQSGGTCVEHGPYVGERCPQWPDCVIGAATSRG